MVQNHATTVYSSQEVWLSAADCGLDSVKLAVFVNCSVHDNVCSLRLNSWFPTHKGFGRSFTIVFFSGSYVNSKIINAHVYYCLIIHL